MGEIKEAGKYRKPGLIASVSARDIAFAQMIAPGTPEAAQYRITGAMPKRIIELLAALQVKHHYPKWSIPSLNLVEVARH